jgi:hypothetical protein
MTFDNLVLTETATGQQIDGFIDGETQARIVFSRRGEQQEIVCVTEVLACAELAAVETLKGWQLVSATLEPLAKWLPYDSGNPRSARASKPNTSASTEH